MELMIERRYRTLCLALGLMLYSGCSGDVAGPPVEKVLLGGVYCQVNGENWSSSASFPYQSFTTYRVDSSRNFIGADNEFDPAGSSSVIIDFHSLMTGPQSIARGRFSRSSAQSIDCDSCGTVNLTEADSVNGRLRGTFEIRSRSSTGDEIVISNGRFYLPFDFRL